MALAVDGRDGGGLVGDDRAQVRKLLGQALPAITVARLDLEKNLTEESKLWHLLMDQNNENHV